MKVVIDIPEEMYTGLELGSFGVKYNVYDLAGCVMYGKPLPKGHGDLKDFQKIYADMTVREELARKRVIDTPTNSPCYMRYIAQLNERTAFKEMLFDAPTIIEADKEEQG